MNTIILAKPKTEAPKTEAPKTDPKTRLCPMYRVLVHNDEVTTVGFVVMVLKQIFSLPQAKAVEVMVEADKTGVALVTVEPLERAEFHVEQCKSLSSAAKYPLTFTYEEDN